MESSQLIYGIRALIEAIKSGQQFEKVFIAQDSQSNSMPSLLALLRKKDISHQHVPIQKLNRLYKGNHQGAVGLISIVKTFGLSEFLDEKMEEKDTTATNLAEIFPGWFGGHTFGYDREMAEFINKIREKLN